MTQRTLMQRLLDERPATQGRDTWAQLEERLSRRRRPRVVLVLVLAAAAAILGVVLGARVTSKEEAPPTVMYLFIARSDRPLSEALELNLGKTP